VVLGTPEPAKAMTKVVESVVASTDGSVDVLAITHEHWDYLSGFIQAADSFKKLKVGEVWVAWTEDPKDDLANTLRDELGKAAEALTASVSRLQGAGEAAADETLYDLAATTFGAAGDGATSTKAAFDKAKAMAVGKPPRMWKPTDGAFEIPGVKARLYALGPPHDAKLIRKINPTQSAPETYALAVDGGGVLPLGVAAALGVVDDSEKHRPFHPRVSIPNKVAKGDPFFQKHYLDAGDWRRVDGDWLGTASNLALALQSYTNNTSLVFALELDDPGGGDVLLFAGDAQVGNWESWQTLKWPQDNPKVTGPDLLQRTIFYKVGHHGSHNATMRQHGLDEMKTLKAAIIPVDEVMAKKKRWGHMPLDTIVEELGKRVAGNMLRTDKTPSAPEAGTIIDPDFFEVPF
jgi:hypothetical protein